MSRWMPVLAFLTAAAVLGLPVGWGIGAGWFCGTVPPGAHQ